MLDNAVEWETKGMMCTVETPLVAQDIRQLPISKTKLLYVSSRYLADMPL